MSLPGPGSVVNFPGKSVSPPARSVPPHTLCITDLQVHLRIGQNIGAPSVSPRGRLESRSRRRREC